MPAAKGNKYSQKYTPQIIDNICEELIAFAQKDKTVHFVEFAVQLNKTQTWLNRMAEDYPKFKETYAMAQELMAAKLVRASVYGDENHPNFNGTHAMRWMPVYSKTYRDYEKWKAEIAKEQPQQAQNQCAFNEWKESQKKDE